MDKCDICDNGSFRILWTGKCRDGGLGVYDTTESVAYQCDNCLSIVISQDQGQGTNYDLQNFTNSHYRKSVDGDSEDFRQNFFNKHISMTLEYLKNIKPESIYDKRVLDFGCGSGLLLDLLSKNIKLGVGIELDAIFHKSDRNICITSDFFGAKKVNKIYDTILSFSAINHVHNLSPVLKTFHEMLDDDGEIIFGLLNPEDILLKIAQDKYSKIFFRKNCPNYFSSRGLTALMNKAGFNHIATKFSQRYGWSNFLSFIDRDHDSETELESSTFKYLVESQGLSDYMYLVFKKK